MLLITELNEDVEYVTEANAAGEKNLYIKGIFLEGDIKNRNGRRYPINVLDKEASRYIKEMVNTSLSTGINLISSEETVTEEEVRSF